MIKYMTVHVPSMKHSIDAQGKNCCSVSSGVEWIGDVELVCFIKTFLCSVSSCLKFFPYGEEAEGVKTRGLFSLALLSFSRIFVN